MYKKFFLFFFIIIYSCSSNYSIYEKKGFAKIIKNDNIISSFPKGTILRITNIKNKESMVITTNEKSKNLGSRVITLPDSILKELKLSKNLPLIHMQSLRKNKIYIAKKTKTYEQEKRVNKKIKIEKINVMNLSEEKKNNDKIYLSFGPFFNKTYANQMYKVLNLKIDNRNLIFKDYKDDNYIISIGPLNNLKEYDKIYLKLGKIGLIGFDIKIQ
mgnify:CR=1 FL=1